MPYSVYLKKNEEKNILNGQCWVYANEVSSIVGKDKNGSLADVYSFDKKFIGRGYINHLSKILVRIFIRDANTVDDKQLYLDRIKKANDYRLDVGYNNCYRMVFGEADNLPALIIDKYDDVLVLQSLSLGIELNKQLIVDCLVELFNPRCVYERSDVSVRKKEGLDETKGILYGELNGKVIINENGLKMAVDVVNGQKTGYFLDQKENRFAVRRYCVNKEVLDCFCNSGGFSINASTVAKKVTSVDISQKALDDVNENASLNDQKNIECVCADVFDLLRKYKNEGKKYDTIILDPPAFTKSFGEIDDAIRGYKDINTLALKLLRPNGYLITSSCSHYVTMQKFQEMLVNSAIESGRTVRFLEIKSIALDHPSLLTDTQSQYLKFFVLQAM